MIKEFKEFLAERKILDFAVGVIIGGALTTIIKSFVDNVINPFVSIFLSSNALSDLHFTISNSRFSYGVFLNDLFNFFLTAFVIFLIIKFLKKAFSKEEEEQKDTQDNELDTLKEIRDLLKKDKPVD